MVLARQKELMTAAPCRSVVSRRTLMMWVACWLRKLMMAVWQPWVYSWAPGWCGVQTPVVVEWQQEWGRLA